MRSMRAPLARVRGLGSAKEGVEHWWAQRLTALALVPLTLWFVYSMVALTGADHGSVALWLARPRNAVLMILLLAATFQHAQLGLQVVIEDYVHGHAARLAAIVAVKFLAVLLATGGIFGVMRIACGVIG
jgi:succinate dehydrogenase / fumarate reductase, membrane anchor subunit